MSLLGFLRNGWASVAANEEQFQARLTAENALDELERFNENPRIQSAARSIEDPVLAFEWLLNSFQYVSGVIAPDHIHMMALYLNQSQVFLNVAPHFYSSTTWIHVIHPLIDRSPSSKRPSLLVALERVGHMQGVATAGMLQPYDFFDKLTESLSVEDAVLFLRGSPSFSIAKQDQGFVVDVLSRYPQYKSLLG